MNIENYMYVKALCKALECHYYSEMLSSLSFHCLVL